MPWRHPCVYVCSSMVLIAMVAVVAGTVWLLDENHYRTPPRYYAAILAADISETSASFVLSLGVALPGPLLTSGGRCLEPGTAVAVGYRGVPLGRALVAGREEVCVEWWTPPRMPRWTRVTARGSNITGEAVARGVRVFDVSLWTTDGRAVWCGARRVGDDNKAAAACDVR